MNDSPYFSDIVSSLEKVLYYERGRGSYFRATMVGTDFIDRKHIGGKTPVEVIENCVKVMCEDHIIKDASFQKDQNGTLFTFEIEDCMHLPVEAKLTEQGIPVYICSPTNMILHKIRGITDLAVEIADIIVDQKQRKCTVRVVVFKQK